MTIEQAIAYIKNPIGKNFEAHAEFERAAISALREQAEREKGCEYCGDPEPNRDCIIPYSNYGIERILCSRDGILLDCYIMERVVKFCPMCGRKLEGNQ